MKTQDIMNLDFRVDESKRIIKKALCRIKPLSKFEDLEEVPLDKLEKMMESMLRKYSISIQYIFPTVVDGNMLFYTASIKRADNHAWLGSVHGCCLYELVAKIVIKLYSEIKNNDIPERSSIATKEKDESEE